MKNLNIKNYMTNSPHTIAAHELIKDAQDMMRKYQVRHFPVLKDKKLIGVITDRDIKLSYSLFSFGQFDDVTVEDICTIEPFVVAPDNSLEYVAETMANRKIGCAIVMDKEKVVGIFTDTDACTALAKMASQEHSE